VSSGYKYLAEAEGLSTGQVQSLLKERSTVRDIQRWFAQWQCFVAASDVGVVGALALEKNDVAEIWVHSQHRGKGIGKALFRKAEQVIAGAGFKELTARCAAASVRPFYEAMGCTGVGVKPCPSGPLIGWPLTHYRKELRARRAERIATTVRQIQSDEWRVLRSVRLAALEEAPEAFSETLAEARAASDDFWQGRTERGARGETSFCAITSDAGQPIGMAVGIVEQGDINNAYLAAMWVAPEYRGTGAAKALVNSVSGWAASRGATILFAGVREGNVRAAAFYRKVGFVLHTGAVPDHPTTNGCGLLLSKMLK
jgi:GNAT superfamily N-acetyltransferase